MEIKKIFVVGAGLMGAGIAQVGAQAGYEVKLFDISAEQVAKGIAGIEKLLGKNVEKGKLTAEAKAEIMGLIKGSSAMEDASDVDMVIEAVYENADLKKSIFSQLDKICKEGCIIASNTSTIPITQLAAAVSTPANFVGVHFFSPVPVMKLCELIPGMKTSDQTLATATEVAEKMGKITVVSKDTPGFIVNRINYALRQEVYRCLEQGVASVEDIDKAMKFGLNHPMGPFELNDFVGLDVGFNGMNTLYNGFKDPRWAPSLTLEKLVLAGDLGRKTGKGWYDYSTGEKKPRTDIKF